MGYQVVECPKAFEAHIQEAFSASGVVGGKSKHPWHLWILVAVLLLCAAGAVGKGVGRGLMPPALSFDDWAPPAQKTSTPWADTPSCWGVVHEFLVEEQRTPKAGMRGVIQHGWRCCRYQRFALLCRLYRHACRALLLCSESGRRRCLRL